jgi:hypothetical protein
MVRTEFTTGGNPAKTGAFRCETTGVRAIRATSRRDRRRIGPGAIVEGGGPLAGRRVMAKVFFPDRGRLAAKGYAAVAHVPVLFGTDGRYLREHNRYLRERARLEWHPGAGGDILRARTLSNIADRLKNFAMWCAARSVDWRTVTYARILDYQSEQIDGKWSALGGKLLPSSPLPDAADIVRRRRFVCTLRCRLRTGSCKPDG